MYNVLEKLRSGEALTQKERTIHEQGLVSVLRQLHDELDAAVLDAYDWSDLLPLLRVAHGNDTLLPSPFGRGGRRPSAQRWGEGSKTRNAAPREAEPSPAPSGHPLPEGEEKILTCADAKRAFDEAILERLVALNAERAAEEAHGLVRWLRPEFQHPSQEVTPQQGEIESGDDSGQTPAPTTAGKPRPWPKETIDQVRAVVDVLATSAAPLSADEIAAHFTARGGWKKRLPPMLEMLVALGRARERDGHYSAL